MARGVQGFWDPNNTGYRFETYEEANAFQLPFSELKNGDRVAIQGSKEIWTVGNAHVSPDYVLPNMYILRSHITVFTADGYYATVERSKIAYVIQDSKDEYSAKSGGQLCLF